jgi:NAD(P)-dependent dehydrogenase (short-subunit alcohol dehydrogenase family)
MKKAFVTGASKGMGLAIAKSLATTNVEVIGTYNSTKPANIKNVSYIKVDLSDRARLQSALKELESQEFNYIVNCAGIFEEESIEHFDLAKWDRSLEVMVTAPYIICHSLTKNMPSGGSIVNIVSDDAYLGEYAGFAYSVAKAGLISLTNSLANVLGHRGIRANSLAPGWVDTDMGPDSDELLEAIKEITPLERIATVEEIAKTTMFLLSDDSSFTTGSVVTVNGGRTNVDYSLYKEWKRS